MNATATACDKLGRVAAVTDPLGAGACFFYDAVGNQARAQDPRLRFGLLFPAPVSEAALMTSPRVHGILPT